MELLLPAGSPEAFYAAIEGGADAVYLGLDRFNARGRAKNFSRKQLLACLRIAHAKNVKVYLTLNTLIKNEELPGLIELLSFVAAIGIDAVIVQDWGVFYIIKKYFQNIAVHASTQMAVHNSAGAGMAARLGFARIVLARELTLPEIAASARAASESGAEIEVFVHGALCYSISGHCLMSSWIGGMSANRGLCRQACRRRYACGKDEEERPVFNLRDLQLVDSLHLLKKVGVRALKVEGRMKPAEYVCRVAQAYRLVLDAYPKEAPQVSAPLPYQRDSAGARTLPSLSQAIRQAEALLEDDLAREKTAFFVGSAQAPVLAHTVQSYTGKVLGRIEQVTQHGFTLTLGSRLRASDRLRIQASSGEDSAPFGIAEIRAAGSSQNERLSSARAATLEECAATQETHAGNRKLKLSADSPAYSEVNQDAQEREVHEVGRRIEIIPRDAHAHVLAAGDLVLIVGTKEMRFPARLPIADITFPKRIRQEKIYDEIVHAARSLQDGGVRGRESRDELIMRIDSLAWLAKVRAEELDALILDFTLGEWAEFECARPSFARNKERFVVQLPLFIPEKALAAWRGVIERLFAAGCTTFIVSQIWQLPLFDGLRGIGLWAAETVYCMNDAAALCIQSLGFERRLLPVENDARNLCLANDKSGVVILYARPRLFVSRVPCLPSGELCRDRTGEYRAELRGEVLQLVPTIPSSWFQYRFDLERQGYSRFLIDLSSERPSQNTFRRMLRHYEEGASVQPSSAFNYKDGLS